MVDKAIIEKIITAIRPQSGETILEIGPGKGALTAHLIGKARLIAVEIDPALVKDLKKQFRSSQVRVIEGNILKKLPHITFDRLVSNVPYSICEPLFRLLPHMRFDAAYVTIPLGFAKLLEGLPYRSQFQFRVLFPVPKTAFSPRPRTQSVFVEVKPISTPLGRMLMKRTSKVKNVVKVILESSGLTKRESRQLLDRLPSPVGEKRVSILTPHEMEDIERFFKKEFKRVRDNSQ